MGSPFPCFPSPTLPPRSFVCCPLGASFLDVWRCVAGCGRVWMWVWGVCTLVRSVYFVCVVSFSESLCPFVCLSVCLRGSRQPPRRFAHDFRCCCTSLSVCLSVSVESVQVCFVERLVVVDTGMRSVIHAKTKTNQSKKKKKKNMRCPGFEPGSTAWKAAMLPLHQQRDSTDRRPILGLCTYGPLHGETAAFAVAFSEPSA